MVKLALAKAIVGIFGGPGPTAAAAGIESIGGFRGGLIKPYAALMSHFAPRAQGLAHGGPPKPKGLHPSDTIPIWAAKGEFMQPIDVVKFYGLPVMEALRNKLIDPLALNALVHTRRMVRNSKKRSLGYAEGGQIAQVIPERKAEQITDQTPGLRSNLPIAALPATAETMDKLLHGGSSELRRWLQNNGYRPQSM
jgi:hypothetical protein